MPILNNQEAFNQLKRSEERSVQLNQLANPSSLWAACTGRRATNHPLSFHLPPLLSLHHGLVLCPTDPADAGAVSRS